MFRYLFFIFIAGSTVLAEKPYDAITKRNAFDLTSQSKVPVTLPPIPLSKGEVYLTGIVRKDKMYTAYMALKDKGSTKYLSLQRGETQDGITVDRITRNSVFIRHSGNPQELTFKRNRFPTVITRAATKSSSKEKKDERGERSKSSDSSKKASKAPTSVSRPHVVTVPSRGSKIDPRLLERGLEYINKLDDPKRKEAILERIEKYQRGEYSSGDSDERRRRYEEWRKSREKRN